MATKTSKIRMEWQGERAAVYIYDKILGNNSGQWEEEGVTPEDVRDLLQTIQNDREIELHINSPGGNVWGGVAIYNLLKQHTGKITGYVDGVAASAASVVLMAADEIIIPTGAFVMIHAPSVLMYGNAAELRAKAEELDKIGAGIAEIYQRRLIDQEESALEMMHQETWFTGAEFQAKFSGVTVEEQAPVYACLGLEKQKYQHIPESVIMEREGKLNTIEAKIGKGVMGINENEVDIQIGGYSLKEMLQSIENAKNILCRTAQVEEINREIKKLQEEINA